MSIKKLGRYELIRVLGKGAMGLVYEGRDPNLDRRVAIKTIKVDNLSAEEAAEYEVRFRTEARSAARLQHPHIVSVYDSDRDGDIAFLVMEFIAGDDLKHHLDKGERYSLAQTLTIMRDLLSALDYAHRQSIVHRDIKPANLLIEPGGRVKLTDFGVARIQDAGETTRTQGSIVGTLKYMSPEQVQGQPIDARADLFAAGIVLYQLLTGKRPFDGDTDFATIQQIVGHDPAPPSQFNPQLPAAIDAVVTRALAKKRDQRYGNAEAFNAALEAAVEDADDPTVLPPTLGTGPGKQSTWTATLLAGEALVGLQSGTSAGVSTVTQEVELVYWKDIKESTDMADIQGFLDKFPAGIYADLARRRLRKLAGKTGEDSDVGARTRTGTLVVTRPSMPAQSPADPDGAWTALAQAAAQVAPASATSAASAPAHGAAAPDPDATRLGGSAGTGSRPAPALSDAVVEQPQAEELAGGEVPAAMAVEPVAPAPAATASSRRGLWIVAAVALLVVGGAVFKLSSGSRAAPVAAGAPAVTATAPVSITPAEPSTASTHAAVTAPVAPLAARKAASDKERAGKAASASAGPAAVPHASASGGPRHACENRVLLGFQICMAEQCAKPVFTNHPVCVERRAIEQRRRELEQNRN